MMKRFVMLLLAVGLCMGTACALAGDYGEAVIDGRDSSRVHLRAAPSKEAESLGLYFTGTPVECRSDPNGEWVEVKIERETGYIKSHYLRRGEAAERVKPRFKKGTVTAINWARMRAGPSTEYQFVRKVNNGANVTIMGETDEHWYYVKVGKDTGFISANLVSMGGSSGGSGTSGGTGTTGGTGTSGGNSGTEVSWKALYRAYVQGGGSSENRYSLIHVNGDSVPELAIRTAAEASGSQILTCRAGHIEVLQTQRRQFHYIERGNRLCNSDGLMDQYFDRVYELRDGKWVCIASGEYYGAGSGWSESMQRYICQTYVWNGQQTTMEGYWSALNRVFPMNQKKTPAFEYDYQQILDVLK
ncbi:MAG: SH3 domain-containing protein [Christensenellales bacterium]|nr:SH3 domain-containing protein [Christensenellales bacterium]